MESKWYAQGVDIAGEKGVGKALTYAENIFIEIFNIATDKDDPDSFQKKLDAKEPINLVNGKQISEMNDLIRKVAELSSSDMQVVRNGLLQHVGAQTLDNVTDKQYPEAMRQLNKWKSNYEIEINKNNTNDQVKISTGAKVMTNELTTNVQFKVDFKASEITIQNESQLKEMVDKAVNHYSSMILQMRIFQKPLKQKRI